MRLRKRPRGVKRMMVVCGFVVMLSLSVAVAASAGSFVKRGVVSHVVDGDTVDVRMANGKVERVRLLGIDTPENGVCFASQATTAASRLATGQPVTLRGDATQDTRDRYGRLLAYVWLPKGRDLGFQLVAGGFAKVYVYDGPFQRLAAYRKAEAGAKGKGIWRCGGGSTNTQPPASPAPAANSQCQAGYSPCLPIVGDLDCGEISSSLKPIRVTGSDPYRLDADGDGYGCDSG
jgi:endonuclease YncB( thermonuclease family)